MTNIDIDIEEEALIDEQEWGVEVEVEEEKEEVETKVDSTSIIEEIHEALEKSLPKKKTYDDYSIPEKILHNDRRANRLKLSFNTLKTQLKENPDYVALVYEDGCTRIAVLNPMNNSLYTMDHIMVSGSGKFLVPVNSEDIKTYHFYNSGNIEGCVYSRLIKNEYSSYNFSNTREHNYILVNLKKLIESNGKLFYVRYKRNLDYHTIIEIKKNFSEAIRRIVSVMSMLKNHVSQVYDETDYDIVLNIPVYYVSSNRVNFNIALRFPDVVIKNSIEQERNIGTVFAYLSGYTKTNYVSQEEEIYLYYNIEGSKYDYSAAEVASSYTHSHLPADSKNNLMGFCLGNFAFPSTENIITEIGLLSLLFGIQDYIRWESLEGGPYVKMESITLLKKLGKDYFDDPETDGDYPRYARKILLDIILKNAEAFKPAFKLVKKNDKYTFEYQKNRFYEIVGNIFKDKDLHDSFPKSFFIYNPSDEAIYYNSLNVTSLEQVNAHAEKKLLRYLPSYFKDKLIFPVLRENEGDDIFSNSLPLPNRRELDMIANTFIEMLNEKLNSSEYTIKI